MRDIFSELYKKVMSFFNNEVKEENSKDTACNRLKLVLMQDRAKMEPSLMEKMREEMIEVISKYVEIDKESLDLNIEAEGDSFALMLNIPVLRAKTREEVEAQEGIDIKDEDDDDFDEDTENEDTENEDAEVAIADEDTSEEETNDEESEEAVGNEDENVTKEPASEEKEPKVSEESEEKPSSSGNEKDVLNEVSSKQHPVKKKIKQQKDDDL